MLLGEVKRDRQRLEQHEAVVDDDRQPAVRIDRQKLRRARAGIADLDRQVLVVEPELLRHPQRAEGAGAGDAVDAQAGHAVFPGLAADHSRKSWPKTKRCQGAARIVSCRPSLRIGNGIRNFLERLSSPHHRIADLRRRPGRDRAGRSARLSRRLYQRASRRAGLYRQGRHPAGAGAFDVQGGGADQAHPHGRCGQTHPPRPSGRYRDPGGGDRSRGRRRPFHLRLRLRLSQPAVRRRARTQP